MLKITNMSRFHIDPLDFAQMVELFEILLNLVESFFSEEERCGCGAVIYALPHNLSMKGT